MNSIKPLSPIAFAWVLGLVVVAFVSVMTYLYIGWFGIFIIGVLGLTVTTNMDLHATHDVSATVKHDVAAEIRIQADRQEKAKKATLAETHAAEEESTKQGRLIYFLNTVWLAMIGLGLAMFSIHQF